MTPWSTLQAHLEETGLISQAAGILSWDQHTFMPAGGRANRGKQLAALSAIVHQRMTDPRLQDVLSSLEAQPDGLDHHQRIALRNTRRAVDKASCTPAALVKSLARATSSAVAAWNQAKAEDDFSIFEPALEDVVALKREAASCRGSAATPYDHMLSDYDPGTTTAQLRPMFRRLSEALQPLVEEATAMAQPPPITDTVPLDGLKALNHRLVDALGFRSEDGRLDESAHPFTLGISPTDVRLTTHYYTNNFLGTIAGTLHETGHGLYEQGLPSRPGTNTDTAAGTGMHESQSRFWENVIGRSLPFCRWLTTCIAEDIPSLSVDAEQLFGGLNRVSRSLIRIHADEVTYNLHIIVRFQLELALIEGDLSVADLPGAWRDSYKTILGVQPTSHAQGVLQDVHWSMGLFGYFPSYTTGNLYAASLRFAMEADLPDMWAGVQRGEFAPILQWLGEHIHAHGSLLDGPELLEQAVGQRDLVDDLIAHFSQRRAVAARIR